MIKCKDCKAFSPQSECGGVCSFTNFGTVKNDDGCHAGAIINDIYNLGKADAIEEFANALINDGKVSAMRVLKVKEQLKEQK